MILLQRDLHFCARVREVEDLRDAIDLLIPVVIGDRNELARLEDRTEVGGDAPWRVPKDRNLVAAEEKADALDARVDAELDRLHPRDEAEKNGDEDEVRHRSWIEANLEPLAGFEPATC